MWDDRGMISVLRGNPATNEGHWHVGTWPFYVVYPDRDWTGYASLLYKNLNEIPYNKIQR